MQRYQHTLTFNTSIEADEAQQQLNTSHYYPTLKNSTLTFTTSTPLSSLLTNYFSHKYFKYTNPISSTYNHLTERG